MCPRELDAKYPQYQFAKHKGYGTKLHYANAGPVRPLPGAPADLPEKVGGQTPWVRPRAPETGARRRWPAICGRRGYTLLASQWRCRFGELDLVARDRRGHRLHRGGEAPGAAAPSPCPGSLWTAASSSGSAARQSCIWRRNELDAPVRFDVAEVYDEGGSLRIDYIENAFI